jgi:hypothetical protein
MDSLHLTITSGKRGTASDHVAYIAREGKYRERNDLLDSGYGNMPSWAQEDPNLLFKASDKYERKNGSTFRSYTVSLPNVLSDAQLIDLACDVTHVIAGIKPFKRALHKPKATLGDEANPHVHAVICDRLPDGIERAPNQMFRRYNRVRPEQGGCRKGSGGLSPGDVRSRLKDLREVLAMTINQALERHGHEQRIDHRTLKERGIDREPERYLGPARMRTMSREDVDDLLAQRALRREPIGLEPARCQAA